MHKADARAALTASPKSSAVRAIVRHRKLNEEQRAAADALMDEYMSALGDYAGTPLARRRR
jgi:uncharacterized protein (UPF0335 family)